MAGGIGRQTYRSAGHYADGRAPAEGVARELINRIQNIRKDSGFEVTDKIRVEIEQKEFVAGAIAKYAGYIASQTLAVEVKAAAQPEGGVVVDSDVDDEPIRIAVTRI